MYIINNEKEKECSSDALPPLSYWRSVSSICEINVMLCFKPGELMVDIFFQISVTQPAEREKERGPWERDGPTPGDVQNNR